jgi:imidazolonepropionase-like amidohydrolase
MRTSSKSLIAAAVVILILAWAMPVGAQQVTALTGATVIDGNGGPPIANGMVLVTGTKITAVGPAGAVSIPPGARRVDVAGKYIVPGLMDANVHLIPWPSWTYIEFLARYEHNFDAIIEEAAQIALKHGFTTVFDTMGPLHPLMRVRDRINRGEIEGARMFVTGDIVGFRCVFNTPETMKSASKAFQSRINALFELNVGQDLPWKTPAEIGEEMRKYVALGVDFVKYGQTGDGAPVTSAIGKGGALLFSPAQTRAMVDAVHAAGKTINTHAGSDEALRVALEAGVDMAQHCASPRASRISDATIKLMLEKKFSCGTQWAPLSEVEQQRLRDQTYSKSEVDNGNEGVNFSLDNAVRLIKAGVPQLVSTDAGTIDPDIAKDWGPGGKGGFGGFSGLIGDAEFLNMRAMRQYGMTPMMIIQAATKNIAAAYKKLDQIGTLEPGKLADLVVLDADPLQDIENMRKVSLVMKEGQTIDRDTLPRHPILTSPEATNPGAVRMK